MTRIKSIAIENPDSRFVIVSKEGKSLKLDGIKNFYRDNYFKYQEVIDKHGK